MSDKGEAAGSADSQASSQSSGGADQSSSSSSSSSSSKLKPVTGRIPLTEEGEQKRAKRKREEEIDAQVAARLEVERRVAAALAATIVATGSPPTGTAGSGAVPVTTGMFLLLPAMMCLRLVVARLVRWVAVWLLVVVLVSVRGRAIGFGLVLLLLWA